MNPFLDAVYDIENDTLYFRNLGRIKPIFKGIDSLYREATQQEVEVFLASDFIELTEEYTALKVKAANRKRIAQVADTLASLNDEQKSQLIDYTNAYCPDIVFENGAFNISSEDQLKRVLYGIEERYYTTQIGQEDRLANSVLTLSATDD